MARPDFIHARRKEIGFHRRTSASWSVRWASFLWLALMIGTGVPQSVDGEEAGNATLLFQYHNNRTTTLNSTLNPALFPFSFPGLSNADVHFEAQQFIPNWGFLKTSFDMSNANGSIRPGRGFVDFSNLSLAGMKWKITLGDHPLNVYTLDYGLNSLFNPYTNLRGAQITASTERISWTVFGGRLASLKGIFAESIQVTEENIYGARARFSISPRWKIGSSLIRATAPETALDRTVPRSTNLATTDVQFQWTKHLQLLGQTSVSKYSGSKITARPEGVDFSYLTAAKLKGVRGSAEVSLLRLAPNFLPLSHYNLGNRAGLFSSGDYQIRPWIAVYGAFNHFRNDLVASRSSSAVAVDYQNVGIRFIPRSHTALTLRFGNSSLDSRGSTSAVVASRNISLDLELSRQLHSWRVVGRYSGNWEQHRRSPLESFSRERTEVELQKNFGGRANAWMNVGRLLEAHRHLGDGRSTLTGRAGFDWTVRPSLSVFSEYNWNQTLVAIRSSSFDSTAFSSGLNWNLPHGVLVSVQGELNRTSNKLSLLDTLTLTPENLSDLENVLFAQQFRRAQITLRVWKHFKWGQRPEEALGLNSPSSASSRLPREYGTIEGVVFDDLDRDGKKSENEPGLSGVVLLLNERIRVPANDQGQFEFKNIPVGHYSVRVDLLSIPANYEAVPVAKLWASVAKRSTTRLHIPLIQLGKIQGRVVLLDSAAKPAGETLVKEIPGANVIVLLNETYKVTFTDSEGEFEFSNIPSGEYRVRIDVDTLPEHTEFVSAEVQPVHLLPGAKITDVKFVVRLKPRPNRRLLVASQTLPRPRPAAASPMEKSSRPAAEMRTGRPERKSTLRSSSERNGREFKIHIVQPKETLQTLALKYYGTTDKWKVIYEVNRNQITASKRLRLGQKLRIPLDAVARAKTATAG